MNYLQNIPFLNNLSPIEAIWLIWLSMLFVFTIFSFILSGQWKHYGVQNSNLRFGEFVYYIIAVLFLGFSALSIILFNAHP